MKQFMLSQLDIFISSLTVGGFYFIFIFRRDLVAVHMGKETSALHPCNKCTSLPNLDIPPQFNFGESSDLVRT
jgi:hypothetical protein